MGKGLVRLYPIDINRMPWEQLSSRDHGIFEKILASDPVNGSATRYLKIDPGAEMPAHVLNRCEETYVLEGSVRYGDRRLQAGAFLCRPPGRTLETMRSDDGCLCIQVCDSSGSLDKEEVVLRPDEIDAMPWMPTPSGYAGHTEKILTKGVSGSFTRLLLIDPGADTTVPDDHEHNEEVLILQGSCKNGEEFHPTGTYTFNPPHTVHGPFLVDEPLLCFEVKNQP